MTNFPTTLVNECVASLFYIIIEASLFFSFSIAPSLFFFSFPFFFILIFIFFSQILPFILLNIKLPIVSRLKKNYYYYYYLGHHQFFMCMLKQNTWFGSFYFTNLFWPFEGVKWRRKTIHGGTSWTGGCLVAFFLIRVLKQSNSLRNKVRTRAFPWSRCGYMYIYAFNISD